MEIKDLYYNSYTITESITTFELFIPIHHYITSNETLLSESQTKFIKSLEDNINDIMSIRTINIKMNFLLYNFDPANADDKMKIDSILEWITTLTNQKLTIKLYLCPSNPDGIDCSMWTIHNNIEMINDDSIVIVFDSNSKISESTYLQSIDNLFRNKHPCYSLSSWSPSTRNILPALYYLDTAVKNQYIRWGYVPKDISLFNYINDITLAFRLKSFSYFIKNEQPITNFKDHLINLYNKYDSIPIVYN